jgi:hypothetical protein
MYAPILFALLLLSGITAASAQDADLRSRTARPQRLQIPYVIPPHLIGIPHELPATNLPILLMGVQNDKPTRGIGQAILLRTQPTELIQWIAFDTATGGTPSVGASAKLGDHIVFLDSDKQIEVVVHDAKRISVKNSSDIFRKGVVVLIW